MGLMRLELLKKYVFSAMNKVYFVNEQSPLKYQNNRLV